MPDPLPNFNFIECIRIAEEDLGKQPVPVPPLPFTWPLALSPNTEKGNALYNVAVRGGISK